MKNKPIKSDNHPVQKTTGLNKSPLAETNGQKTTPALTDEERFFDVKQTDQKKPTTQKANAFDEEE